ncbi:expressed unknown protein [Seminavis robusta]|uniref:Uncharacterized protein n=1 Tax=Seminavis robusta TaxID=568900 RepID=A0A9N8DUS0_9STRA|nr:expressed unknown protein [Seminavis robusta]|eukprot:Sro373_g128920.1 n/a (232) ;mRNA; r:2633-3328
MQSNNTVAANMANPAATEAPTKLRRSTGSMPTKKAVVVNKQIRGSTGTLPRRRRRVVSFGTVQIREFERIAGDNPAVSQGPSLSLGWKSIDQKPLTVRKYEDTRERASVLTPLTRETRKFLLTFVFDVSSEDIKRSEKSAAKIQAQRHETIKQLLHNKAIRRKKSFPPRQVDTPELENTSTTTTTSSKPQVVIEDPLPRKHVAGNTKLLRKVEDARKRLLEQGWATYARLQ